MQISHPTQDSRRSDRLDPDEHTAESTSENNIERFLITHIRTANVTTRLRRIPVGFYVVVKTEIGTERTSNKPALAGKDVVEWDDRIVLPSDRSSRVSLTVYASFELGPTLGSGERLCEFEAAVGGLLDHQGQQPELIRPAKQSDAEGDSPTLSCEIEIERRVYCIAASSPLESEETRHLGELTDIGHHALIRYRELQEQRDLGDAIKYFKHARDHCPQDHPSRAIVLFNLATAKLIHYRANDVSNGLDVSIDLCRDALRLRPPGHPDHPSTLLSLGVALEARFQRQLDEVDGTESKSLLSQVLDATAADSYGYHAAILALGSAATSEMIQSKEISEAFRNDEEVQRLDAVLQRIFYANFCEDTLLDHLGILFCIRLDRLDDFGDPEKAISTLGLVVQLTYDDHPDKPAWLINLGNSLLSRYLCHDDRGDLDKSISMFEDVVRLTPDGHPSKHYRLSHLGTSLSRRYKRFGDVVDMERSTSLREDIVNFTPDGDPDKPLYIHNLADSLLTRYRRFGDVADMERSILLREDAVKFTPDGHPDKPLYLDNLGRILSTRYERFGDLTDLERSISLKEDIVQLTPDGHPDKPLWMNNLSSSLLTRYLHSGVVADLERSISLFEDVVKFTPDGHPDKPLRLNNLGDSLSTRYERFGDVTDLDRSISLFQDAVQFTPDGHPNKPLRLNNLGDSLSTRYERFGDVADLERSISLFEDAARLTPDGHLDKPLRLSNLGDSLSIRYERFGDVADLERSISLFEDVVRFTPDRHPDKPLRLNNLGGSLLTRYERFRSVVDLERSISLREDAVKLTPNGHPDEPLYLNNLSKVLSTRYERLEDVASLERSNSLLKDVVQLTPSGHPNKPLYLSNLGRMLSTRYERLGDVTDLEKSISLLKDAVELTPDEHLGQPSQLNNLASSLLERFRHSGGLSHSDLSQAILYSSRAARSHAGLSAVRFEASRIWIQCIRLLRHDSQSLLDAYTVAIELLPQLAWLGLSLHGRYDRLLLATDGARDAAAAALDVSKPALAVEWLEQGRSIVWSQLSQLRTPVDDLRLAHPELAARFEHVSRALEHASARDGEGMVGKLAVQSDTQAGVLEGEARQHHSLALSRERLLADIRALPGFERFLFPKTIAQLSSLVHSGPVVFLNASKYKCGALVVVASSERVIHVPLLNTNYGEIGGMQLRLNELLRIKGRVGVRDDLERGARVRAITPDDVFRSILPYLWHKVVGPILEVLPLSTSDGKLPRIFWCPTGPFSFLPIHAAGIYSASNPGPKLSDFVISSYIPTMSALEPPPQDESEAVSRNIRLLAVPQPSTDGQDYLGGVRGEIDTIRKLATSSPFVGFREADGTVEDVVSKMTETDWVHFACHGVQDRINPYDSGFVLAHGKRLKLPDIARLSRPRTGGLAFLSACYTATGDQHLSEEVIHIAGGMLLAGYRSVIATMWSIRDDDAPRVTEDVYKSLFSDGRVPDSREAAEALHHAVGRLRDSGVSFLSWVPFIHVGL